MNKTDIEKFGLVQRTEEVKDIIERMPAKFGWRISLIVLFITILMFVFGWAVRYPDIVTGQITINTPTAPIKLVANTSGKLKLSIKQSQTAVNADDVIGYIENNTSYDTLMLVKQILSSFNPNITDDAQILNKLPATVTLGELNSKYYNFLNSLHQTDNFNSDRLYDKQIADLGSLFAQQQKEIANSNTIIEINNELQKFSEKFLMRDSYLLKEKVAAEIELDKSKINYIQGKSNITNAKRSKIEAEKQSQQTISKITEIKIQKSEKQKELKLALLASYNDLMDNITLWEQRYLFTAPFGGKVQFLKFWTDNQFIQSGEPVFTIVPEANAVYGQVYLPAYGAGKVKLEQEAIVKLDDFPYNEYGSVKGVVKNISLTTNTEKTSQGNIETYLITVQFPDGLKTNYKRILDFRHEAKGSTEIITNDRRLIERLFDNLKYVLNK